MPLDATKRTKLSHKYVGGPLSSGSLRAHPRAADVDHNHMCGRHAVRIAGASASTSGGVVGVHDLSPRVGDGRRVVEVPCAQLGRQHRFHKKLSGALKSEVELDRIDLQGAFQGRNQLIEPPAAEQLVPLWM